MDDTQESTNPRRKPKDHFIERPIFGVPPEQEHLLKPVVRFEFEDLLDMVRERPGEWAKIAVYKGSNRKKILNEARASRARVWRFLQTQCPLEEWKVSVRPTPDTWCDRELWCKYVGTMTPEEALKVKHLRFDAFATEAHPHLDDKAKNQARLHARALLKDWEKRRSAPGIG